MPLDKKSILQVKEKKLLDQAQKFCNSYDLLNLVLASIFAGIYWTKKRNIIKIVFGYVLNEC